MSEMTDWKIVLVDDEPDALNVIYHMLTHNGIEVHRAVDGEECLALLEGLKPTCIVVDLAMPKVDGWSVLSRVRANPDKAHLPIIAITAYHSANVAEEAYRAGFDGYFAKPVKSDEFMAKLTELANIPN